MHKHILRKSLHIFYLTSEACFNFDWGRKCVCHLLRRPGLYIKHDIFHLFLRNLFAKKHVSSWTKRQSCQRRMKGRMYHRMRRTEKSWIALLKALWLTTHTAHRAWTVGQNGTTYKFAWGTDAHTLSSCPADSEMHCVYLKSVRSPAVQGKFKMSYKNHHNMEIFSQV